MKALLLAVIGLNLVFYLYTNLDQSADTQTADADISIPKGVQKLDVIDRNQASSTIVINTARHLASKSTATPRKVVRTETRVEKRVATTSATGSRKQFDRSPVFGNSKNTSRKVTVASYSKNTSTSAGKNLTCIALGPFVDKDDAHELNETLIANNVDSRVKSFKEKERIWVFLQGRSARDSAKPAIRVLRRKGVRKYRLKRSRGKPYEIQLGWYSSSDAATRRMKQLRAWGLVPKFRVEGSKGEQIWLNYTLPRGKKLPRGAQSAIFRTRKEVYLREKRCGS